MNKNKDKCLNELMKKYYGKLEKCTTSAIIKGPCGDEMEMYIRIEDDKITEIKVFTTGCIYTKTCGVTLANMVDDKTINEAMDISAKDVKDKNPTIPEDHIHCNILAVSVLYRAIALYLMN